MIAIRSIGNLISTAADYASVGDEKGKLPSDPITVKRQETPTSDKSDRSDRHSSNETLAACHVKLGKPLRPIIQSRKRVIDPLHCAASEDAQQQQRLAQHRQHRLPLANQPAATTGHSHGRQRSSARRAGRNSPPEPKEQ